MSAKTSPARRAAFFAALRETGNQTLAAERAKVSRSWVCLHRAEDPAFRAALEAALADARDRLGKATRVGPPAKWRAQLGEELAVRGTNGRRAQIARARLKQWTPRLEARFLAMLCRTANVDAACRVVGLSTASAYGHRHRWPDFARRWDAAAEAGSLRLEGALIDAAGRCLDPAGAVEEPLDVPIAPMTVADAIRLMRLRGKAYNRCKGPPGRPRAPMPVEAIRAEVMKRIERVVRVGRWREAQAGRASARSGDED